MYKYLLIVLFCFNFIQSSAPALSNNVKVVIFVPLGYGDAIREAVGNAGAGSFDGYDFCSSSSQILGYWRPLEGSSPVVGEVGSLGSALEEKIDFVCPYEILEKVIHAAQEVHPYEVMGFDVYPLIDFPMQKR